MYLFLYDNIDIIYFQTLVLLCINLLYKVQIVQSTYQIVHTVSCYYYIIMFMFIYLFLFFLLFKSVHILYCVWYFKPFFECDNSFFNFCSSLLLLSSLSPPRPSSPFTNTETIHIAKSLSQSNLKSWTCFSSAFNLSSHTSS